ncbi:PAS domain S-box protein [Mucilaginibacter gotjawali]|uniref:histidine kinase n=2 Tax=Mucilaginibacter gotjawali TaxID=1550579 RepID=A0A0X8X3Z7_9SPHI|nr:PAS domain S-box protein [Mucilaginibacter gotjawali]MBB3057547.1 PAS domain S-box-containing protein [Mucilaginibacter gotjawali]BAU55205.1 Autoinducer 2 sensor kinase/phosphatase LuxQ [Mucilaginibacter gotjawali]
MSFKIKLLFILQNDNTIYRLLLAGLLIANPALHYLCLYNSYDPIWLRAINTGLCFVALGLSFYPGKYFAIFSQYAAILSFLVINNCILLSRNGFSHIYLFSAITIFIALTLFCKKRWEFVTICLLNLLATLVAYFTAAQLNISVIVLVVLLLTFTLIAYVSFLVKMAYKLKFNKAVNHVVELNKSLMVNDEMLRGKRNNLNSLINSLNEIIFEFDENKICLNTWFRKTDDRIIDPAIFTGKKLSDVFGYDKAKKYDDALDEVIKTRRQITIEFNSDFGSGRWFVARLAPVFDPAGNYTFRISASVTDISEQKKYADELKEKEALLLEAQAIAKTGNWSYDHSTKETYWSKSLYNILEIDSIPEDISKYEYYISLIHPDDRDKAYRYFSNLKETYESQFEYRLITPNGNLKYFRALKGELITYENGTPRRSFGVLQDITETKLSEKKIKVSQAELEEAQTIAKIGNWKWDVTMNKLTWSDEINNIFELDQASIAEQNFIKLLTKYAHPNDRHILKQHLKDLSKITNTSYEYRIITPNGNIKYLSIIVGKLIKREDGALRKVIGTLQDITDRKLAELESQRTENKYKLVLETIKLPAVSIDSNGDVIFCNKHAAEMLGFEQTEILGLNWINNFVPENSRNNTSELFESDSFKPQNINSVICRNGEQRVISWQNTISYDENGQIKEVTGIGEDITERQKKTLELITAKEQAEKSSQFKSEFLSIMSHEIRTPMNAVIGTTNLLLGEDPKPDQLEYLNILKFSGENLLAIINDILDYNKIEAGKLELNKIPFSIHHLTQRIKKSFYAKATEKDLDIELVIDDDIPALLMGDQVRLGQVLNNLVSNAIKFTHYGKVIIRLDQQLLTGSSVKINFTITDTGIGIAPENLHIIFDPFEQETQNSDANYGGTGLGLAITKRLIELHNSTISVTSKPGYGTEFTFSILFEIAPPEEKKDDTALIIAPNSTPDLLGMRVLIVDDNKMNIMIASKFLKKWQANPDEAISGHEAIELTKQNNYDLIIMDLQMPGMDGFEATRIIKRSNPQIPILALTADAMPETHSKAFAAGMCDYLTKPFIPNMLFEKVARYYVAVEG